jgi:hypothetical protein
MKKTKCVLGLAALLAACTALTGCNRATPDSNGSLLTYTDPQGNVVAYSAEDLLENYQDTSSTALSTDFDKIYEVLIRRYYQQDDATIQATLTELKKKAAEKVASDKEEANTNATTNKTSYEVEFEKILKNKNCKNVDQLYEYELYTVEKEKFESNYYSSNLDAMRDGSSKGLEGTNDIFPSSEYGAENPGWLKDQMPYQVRHILVKVSAASGDYTEGVIAENAGADKGGEATKLATVIEALAGADKNSQALANRPTFGEIALNNSDDSSASSFGELSLMTKVMSEDWVHEMKLGIYAYESLYRESSSYVTDYAKNNAYRLAPGLKESSSDVDPDQVLSDDSTKTINQFFKDGESDDSGTSTGIGQIPYGAAVAMMKAAKITTDASGNNVYEGKDIFLPRNILFNKYFNKHNICIITPNEIAYNTADLSADSPAFSTDYQKENGTYSATYAALPGFQHDTTNIFGTRFGGHNVLTDDEGQVVLAVRAGASSYQGIHFIVLQRSALSEFGSKISGDAATGKLVENATQDADTPTLSQFYNTKTPGQDGYPVKSDGKTPMTTYINYNKHVQADYNTRQSTVITALKSFNGSLSTYMFQDLILGNKYTAIGKIEFTDAAMGEKMKNYISAKRQSTIDDNFTTWSQNWKDYAEMLEAQKVAREQGKNNGTGKLLSEVCAIGFAKHNGTAWEKGGACYYVK